MITLNLSQRSVLYFVKSLNVLMANIYMSDPWGPNQTTHTHLAAVQETWVRSLGLEDSLVEGMATHSSILAWRIPWTEEPGEIRP